jgi:synaptojanin
LKKRTNEQYGCLLRKVMFGCYIMLFVRVDNFKHITNMHTVKIKTGASGMAANKGSVAMRFNFHDTSFMFLNCHLTSGQKKVKERVTNLQQVVDESVNHFIREQDYATSKGEYQHHEAMRE